MLKLIDFLQLNVYSRRSNVKIRPISYLYNLLNAIHFLFAAQIRHFMKLYPIESRKFQIVGGAMFGVVPKTLWNRTNPADANNLIDIAARCLLIEIGNRLILIDTGMGNKQDDKFFGHYALWGNDSIDGSLAQHGFHRNDITDVFMTHLHFDHCGGSIQWNKDRTSYEPAFKNARFWTNENHWQWATNPNAREKASFLKENILPMQESGHLQFITSPQADYSYNNDLGFSILFVDGHTEKQMIPHIQYKGKTLVFMAIYFLQLDTFLFHM